jgi:type IV pilus secretin PilQ/predicted competence protein
MKTNWPAYRLTAVLLVSLAAIASAASAQTGPPAASPATVIASVEIGRSGAQTDVRVLGDGQLSYQVARLHDPERLVLDFSGARLGAERNFLSSDAKLVRRVRLSQFKPDVTRLVVDLNQNARYSVRNEGKNVIIAFTAEGPAVRPAKNAGHPLTFATLNLGNLPLPESLVQPVSGLARPAPQQAGDDPAAARAKNAPAQPAASGSAAGRPQQPAAKYTGEPISVNLKDVDLKDFFRLIHEISGLNVVLDPSVKGSVPALVLDEVPWDQALDIVLRNNQLDKQLEGNVLRIATKETIKKEAEMRRDLAKVEAEAIEPVTTTRVLSYAKAAQLRDTLKRFLSTRGEILSDDRSNTLIIRDIPNVMPGIDNLIRQLDRKAQQVEIEARVVAASRSFARDIGSQFAFAGLSLGGRNVFGGVPLVGISPQLHSVVPPLVASPTVVPNSSLGGTGAFPIPLNTNLGAATPTSGIAFSHTSPNFALDYIITAAESKGVGKLLSSPKVYTQNNEKGTVKQGTKIPVQTIINNTISVQFVDAVLKLEVTPQITAEGTVSMEVVIENTQIDQGIPRVQGIPALDTQAVESHVLINDGGTVVIGGMIISSQRNQINQVPLIGSIPLIGHLFKRTTLNVDSQELLFFLTPRIAPN